MRLQQAIVHDANPGYSAAHLRQQLQTLEVPPRHVGVEMDVTLKKLKGENDYTPVAISRDRAVRVDLETHIRKFMDHGFHGPYFLDLIDRRATNAVIKVLDRFGPEENLLVQAPEMAMQYKTPWAHNSGQFAVEEFWIKAWPHLTVSSRMPHLAKEFVSQGQKLNLFWEPIDDVQYRRDLIDLVKAADFILYKMPHLTYSAKFDPNKCMERDLDFFNSVAKEMFVAPMGSVELPREHGKALFGETPRAGATDENRPPTIPFARSAS